MRILLPAGQNLLLTKFMIYRLLTVFVFITFMSADNISVKSELSAKEQVEIVEAHNTWRRLVGTEDIKWSDELASQAQQWANKLAKRSCKMDHSNTINGENLYWSSAASSAKEVVDAWASEKKYYKGGTIKGRDFRKYGHYTQIVWNRTKFVGCGMAVCKHGNQIWVCHYSPAGNYLGKKAY